MTGQATREEVFSRMVQSLETRGMLLVGPQGIGKTFMLERLRTHLTDSQDWLIENIDVRGEFDLQAFLAIPEAMSSQAETKKCIFIDDLDQLATLNIPWLGEAFSRFMQSANLHQIKIASTSRADPYELGDAIGKALLQLETIYLGPLSPEEAQSLVRERDPGASESVVSLTGQASGYVPALIEATLERVTNTSEMASEGQIVDFAKEARAEDTAFDWIEESALNAPNDDGTNN